MYYDVFNGDADGIFALHQYRLSFPVNSAQQQLVTGVKRDIRLLDYIDDTSQQITVFDISLDSNRSSLQRLLTRQNSINWFDHHFAGDIPTHPLLQTTINPSSKVCSSLIVNEQIDGRFALWAICGAFGDNLHKPASLLAEKMQLKKREITSLAELGELFNYNGYGHSLQDLHFHPAALYQAIQPYENPLDFIADAEELQQLRSGYQQDMANAENKATLQMEGKNRIFIFPDTPWARRVSGVFSNCKAREKEDAAHAIVTEKDTALRISVRAPLSAPHHADTLCKKFPTGGGRAAAAGINTLPKADFPHFCRTFAATFS